MRQRPGPSRPNRSRDRAPSWHCWHLWWTQAPCQRRNFPTISFGEGSLACEENRSGVVDNDHGRDMLDTQSDGARGKDLRVADADLLREDPVALLLTTRCHEHDGDVGD